MKTPLILSALAPVAFGLTPAGRWGHQAVYVPSQAAMYIVGGQVSTSNNQITNDVLVMPLNGTSSGFSLGSNSGLPPHAFASMAMTPDESSLIVVGGMTSSCANDGLAHTLDISGGSWTSISPASMVRRRGAEMAWVDTGSGQGAMMLVGGMADNYACASSSSAYTAADVLALPLRASSLLSSRTLPSSLTGSQLAVADYALASNNGTLYLVGGQTSSGSLVSLSTIGVWDEEAGWHSRTTSGDVPPARIGATLVAHPSLDLLILHGGSTSSSGTDTPTSLLALLNTTSMTWSMPSKLQPPAASAKSYHSSIMTPSGVMITAFGLSSSNTPRADVTYLDARSDSTDSWTWASSWTSDLLTSTIKSPETGVASSGSGSSGLSGGAIAGIVVPLLLLAIVGCPILVYLVRRRMRLIKKRRMAEHFSFSSQEDSANRGSGGFTSRLFGLDRRGSESGRRVTNAQYPFGRDANEKEGTFLSDLGTRARGLLRRYSTRSSTNSTLASRNIDRDATEVGVGGYSEKEMRPVSAMTMNPRTAKWEEIDFGLGRVDESRRASDAYESTAMTTMPTARPLINLNDDDDEPLAKVRQQNRLSSYGSPQHDGQAPLIPSLVVVPPSNPSTPGSINSTLHPSPLQASNPFADPMPTVHEYAAEPSSSSPAQDQDWSALQKTLDDKPAFRSISPTSTLRSHQHLPQRNIMQPRTPVPAYTPTPSSPKQQVQRSATPPQLPPLEIHEPFGRTITLVNPKTGRRVSETLPLTGRRGSLPLAGAGGSAMVRSPSSSGSTTPRASYDATLRRSSNPVPFVQAKQAQSPTLGSPTGSTNGQRRASAMSRLRIMNPSSDDESTESAPGTAV